MTQLDVFLQKGPTNGSIATSLDELRRLVLLDGIPSNPDGMSDIRIAIWLILLDAPPLRTQTYLDLVGQAASPAHAKIRDDTFRTLTTDPLFRRRVSENSLTRVLNAVAWKLHDAHEARVNGWTSPPTLAAPRSLDGTAGGATSDFLLTPSSTTAPGFPASTTPGFPASTTSGSPPPDPPSVGYVQGMNVLAAPFLYAARSEVEAFAALDACITHACPGYVRGGSLAGVHRGLALVDRLLALVDPRLAAHLRAAGMSAEIYGFASVLTLCACTPPLPEVLRWWDFLFAYGPHLNLLGVVAQVVLLRDALLASASPKPDFKPLRAQAIIDYTVNFARKIPDELYEEMLLHAQ